MHKLIIVDDNEIIRNGIANIVDWASLGYEVPALLSNGKEAIQYISKNFSDVILANVKMPYISGVEIARYLYENQLNIKIVLMGDLKDFDSTKKAIQYQIEYYLLKPMNLDEIHNIFKRISIKLDKEIREAETISNERKKYNMLISMLEEQFFKDIANGELNNKEDIVQRIQLLNLNIDADKSRISIINLKFNDQNKIKQDFFRYNNRNIFILLKDFLLKGKEKNKDYPVECIKYIPIFQKDESIIIFAVDLYNSNSLNTSEMIKNINSFLKEIIYNIQISAGVIISIERINTFNSIIDFVSENPEPVPRELSMEKRENYYLLFKEQRNVLAKCIKEKDIIGVRKFIDEVLRNIKNMHISLIHETVISIMAILDSLLLDDNSSVFLLSGGKICYSQIMGLADINEVKDWCGILIKEILNYFEHSGSSERTIIKKARQLINDNIQNGISLDDMASKIYLNPVYFSRLFKQQTGETFTEYILKVRMEKAIDLLKSSSLKVYEISEIIGYKNIKYFYKVFKKYTGITPLELRENRGLINL